VLWGICLGKISEHVESSPFSYWRKYKDKQQKKDDISDDQQIDNLKEFFDR
jgi:hypothetical protein